MPAPPADERTRAVARAFSALLQALGLEATGEFEGTPQRAADLWLNHLLAGYAYDLRRLAERSSPSTSTSPVSVLHLGVHMVCPHHLTVASGVAHLAYVPGGRLAGFGVLSDVVQACTARPVLQEDATNAIAQTMVEHFQARGAVAVIEASHPCHTIVHPRAHQARAVTWGTAGDKHATQELTSALGHQLAHR